MTGTDVQLLRRKLRLTQAELAARLGVHALTVSRWERGQVRITEPMARLLKLQPTTAPATRKGGHRR